MKSKLKSGETLLVALCPYRIDNLKLSGGKSVKRGGKLTLNIEVEADKAETLSNHVVNLKVYDPDNRNRIYLNRNLYLKGGVGEYSIPIALNDKKGGWRIEAKEVVSGITATNKFSVRTDRTDKTY